MDLAVDKFRLAVGVGHEAERCGIKTEPVPQNLTQPAMRGDKSFREDGKDKTTGTPPFITGEQALELIQARCVMIE